MVDNSSSKLRLQLTQTAISEESADGPKKPDNLTGSKKLMTRKRTEQQLYKVHSSKLSLQQSNDSRLQRDVSSLIVLASEGNEEKNSNLIRSQQNIIISKNALQGSDSKKMGQQSELFKDKRTSINSYQRRVVELNLNPAKSLNHNQSMKTLVPQSAKNLSVKQLSLDISSVMPIPERKANELKKVLGDQSNLPETKLKITSTQISPKNQGFNYSSPRFSINSVHQAITKSKQQLRKPPPDLSLNQSEVDPSLIKSPRLTTVLSQARVTSATNSSSKKSHLLLRNLSSDKSLKISQDHIHSSRLTAHLSKNFSSKRDSLRYYSPTQMSLHKALSRISSVGELQKVKEIGKTRKSIQNSSRLTMAGARQAIEAQIGIQDQVQEEEDQQQDYLTNQEKLWTAIEQKVEISIIEEILKMKDVQVDAGNIFDERWTALHYAVHEGYYEAVKLLVEKYNASLEVRSATNKTPLHLACIRADPQILKYLLSHCPNSCCVDRDGSTPMHYICESQAPELIKLLLPTAQGSLEVRNRFGLKPLDLIRDQNLRKEFRQHQRQSSVNGGAKTRLSCSREREMMNVVHIQRISEEKMQECIQSLFRKFSLYKNTALTARTAQMPSARQQSKEFTVQSKPTTATTTANHSKKPTQGKSSKLVQQYTSRVTKNKTQPMFPASSTTVSSTLLSKNVSPNKPLPPKKVSQNNTLLQESQSQKDLGIRTSEPKRLTQIKSQTNILLKESTTKCKDTKPDDEDEYQAASKPELSCQRTGESSQIIDQSIVTKTQKQSITEEPQEKMPTSQKIGPWSFIAHQLLGTGSFGEVYLVEKISCGKYYAMKVLSKAKIMGHNLTRYALTERNVLSLADHPFIVRLNYAFQTQEKLFLILDYCPGGDLAEYLQLEKRFNEDKTRLYAAEITLALEELHRKDIIFRDLKPDNVVLDMEGHAMLTDFGLSKEGVIENGMAKSFCGSYAYLAPEMLRKQGHGKAVDWYLLGVVIYEMLCGTPPYYANNKEELFDNIKNAQLDLPPYLSPVAKDLISTLMNRNPIKRLGALLGGEEVRKHPFFKGIDWDKLYRRQYKPPEPYLKKRFENFLQLSPQMQTNAEVYEQLRKQAISGNNEAEKIAGWSFVSPQKENE